LLADFACGRFSCNRGERGRQNPQSEVPNPKPEQVQTVTDGLRINRQGICVHIVRCRFLRGFCVRLGQFCVRFCVRRGGFCVRTFRNRGSGVQKCKSSGRYRPNRPTVQKRPFFSRKCTRPTSNVPSKICGVPSNGCLCNTVTPARGVSDIKLCARSGPAGLTAQTTAFSLLPRSSLGGFSCLSEMSETSGAGTPLPVCGGICVQIAKERAPRVLPGPAHALGAASAGGESPEKNGNGKDAR
jgi:hypothetical protein